MRLIGVQKKLSKKLLQIDKSELVTLENKTFAACVFGKRLGNILFVYLVAYLSS